MDLILRRRRLGNTSCREIAKRSECGIKVLRNDSNLPDRVNTLFRWGCTSKQDANVTVNTTKAIGLCSDKYQSRLAFEEAGVSIPKTWGGYASHWSVDGLPREGVIIRNHQHHQGRHLVHATTQSELENGYYLLRERGPVYISEYIPKVREYRVYVVQGRVVMVAEKTPASKSDIAWNHYLGGSFENVRWKQWPILACLEGIKAHRALGLDFSGIDVMEDTGGLPYVLEGNSAPSLTSEYRQTCMAKVFDYIAKNGKHQIELSTPKIGKRPIYSHLIHPALAEEARMV